MYGPVGGQLVTKYFAYVYYCVTRLRVRVSRSFLILSRNRSPQRRFSLAIVLGRVRFISSCIRRYSRIVRASVDSAAVETRPESQLIPIFGVSAHHSAPYAALREKRYRY